MYVYIRESLSYEDIGKKLIHVKTRPAHMTLLYEKIIKSSYIIPNVPAVHIIDAIAAYLSLDYNNNF